MADIGDANNIHPKDKVDVGHRLALVAEHVAYGRNLVYCGPTYDSMKIEGNKIRLSFKNIGSGLQIGTPPWTPEGMAAPMAAELTGFAVAGTDKYTWFWAKAQIDGDTVVVSSDQVPAPTAARYGWANNPPCNLYNKEGLPAAPFRTDDWKDSWQNGPADKQAHTPVSQRVAPAPRPSGTRWFYQCRTDGSHPKIAVIEDAAPLRNFRTQSSRRPAPTGRSNYPVQLGPHSPRKPSRCG